MSHWLLRQRVTAQGSNAGSPQQNGRVVQPTRRLPAIIENAMALIRQTFPQGAPQIPVVYTDGAGSPYHHHPGDIFTPGAESWVYEHPWEQPLYSDWGGGGAAQGWLISKPQFFNPLQPSQIWSDPNVIAQGLGGLQAGQITYPPLLDTETFNGG